MGFAVRGHHLPPKILSEKFPLEESFFCRQHWTVSTGFFHNRRKFFVKVKQSRYFPGCMGLNPLLHVIQSCAGGRSKGEISAFVDHRGLRLLGADDGVALLEVVDRDAGAP